MSRRRSPQQSRRISPRSLSTWTPLNLPGLTSFFRADKGVTLNVSAVSAWADQSGAGLLTSVSQGTGSAQPSFVASGVGGKADIQYNNSLAQCLTGNSTLLSGSTAITLFGVFQSPGSTGDLFVYGMQFNAFEYSVFLKQAGNVSVFAGSGTNTLVSPAATYINNSPHCWIMTADLSSGAMALYIDSATAVATMNTASGTITNGVSDKNAVGQSTGSASGDRQFLGSLPVVGSCNVAVGTSDVTQLMTWLKQWAGI